MESAILDETARQEFFAGTRAGLKNATNAANPNPDRIERKNV
jgi:hypothetical protein